MFFQLRLGSVGPSIDTTRLTRILEACGAHQIYIWALSRKHFHVPEIMEDIHSNMCGIGLLASNADRVTQST